MLDTFGRPVPPTVTLPDRRPAIVVADDKTAEACAYALQLLAMRYSDRAAGRTSRHLADCFWRAAAELGADIDVGEPAPRAAVEAVRCQDGRVVVAVGGRDDAVAAAQLLALAADGLPDRARLAAYGLVDALLDCVHELDG